MHLLQRIRITTPRFMNIDSGAADAVAVDIGVANYQLSQRGKDKYVILDEPIQNEQYGIGFKKGNDELKRSGMG